ncbi:nicotinate mononucleotide-dependent phosphoribosyltransferase CobT [Methanocrinis sp.]|uniref:nicotinate mononucleotide-dependent phosphoribosyltransferase CobT n=1 Tax=Methanocrinis sp. TaxID=3101522 RepID=UPI003D0EFC57
MQDWIHPHFDYLPERPLFLCVLSNTDTGKIPGLSAAGASPDLTDYTPSADAELVELHKIVTIPEVPESPEGATTPAVVTKAALSLSGVPSLFVTSGLRRKPAVPYVDMNGSAGSDIRLATAIPDVADIMDRATMLGRKLAAFSDCIFIGESIAGGTTTAMAVMQALGYDGRVSSSLLDHPLAKKQEIVDAALDRCGASFGSMRSDPLRALMEVGDPMIPAVLGMLKGLSGTKTVLAGGTQMAAVLCAADALGLGGDVSIATTRYIVEDRNASFVETVEGLGRRWYMADPGLERSKIPALSCYARGSAKEGVGAGGAVLAASLSGVTQQEIVEGSDRVLMTVELPKKSGRA